MRLMTQAAHVAFAAALLAASAAAPEPVFRDVLATAFHYPFLTDAEVDMHLDDTHGRITCKGGPVFFRYPRIAAVELRGARQEGQRLAPDLLRVDLPAGTHDVAIVTDKAVPAAGPHQTDESAVSTLDAFRARAAQLKPGDTLVVADGIYADWQAKITAQGTAEQPVVIRPQTPGGVTFTRNIEISLRSCRFVVFKGFRFEHCGPRTTVSVQETSDCRVTQCHFFHCGNPRSTFGHIVEVGMGSDRNRVDHCYFTGSKSMSLAQRISAVEGVGTDNRFDHNLFRDMYRYWVNGQENIQIGQNSRQPTGDAQPRLLVERNVFDHAWGDSEIISNKSSGNVIRHNLAAHCRRSAFTLRGGNEVSFEGNVMVNNACGLRVMGQRHTIVNNLILDQPEWGILLETGHKDGQSNVATEGSLIAHNTIVNCGSGAIGGHETDESRPHKPGRNRFENNLLVGRTGTLLDTRHFLDSTVRRNLYWAVGSATTGEKGAEAIVQDPRLEGSGPSLRPSAHSPAIDRASAIETVTRDRWNRPRPNGSAPDIGADEVGAQVKPGEEVVLPPVPRRPLLVPEMFMQDALFAQDAANPINGWKGEAGVAAKDGALALADATVDLQSPLPVDFVMQWEYLPGTFASEAALRFCADASGHGYTLAWGGNDKDGKPSSVILLRKGLAQTVIADAADVVYYYQDFRKQDWLGKTLNASATPDPKRWYRFTLLKQGGRLILLLGDTRRLAEPGIPVLICDDRGVLGGPAPNGTGLRITQRGAGSWRAFALWRCGYSGDLQPPPPVELSATAIGGQRVVLRWRDGKSGRAGYLYDVHRATQPNFTPSSENLIARHVGGASFNDFTVQPQTRYHYKVRTLSRFGVESGFAAVEATTGAGGPLYRVFEAGQARTITAPMILKADGGPKLRYLWTPSSAGMFLKEPPAEAVAELALSVEKSGDYGLWGLVRGPSDGEDSFWISLDTLGGGAFRAWHLGVHPSWAWTKLASPARLTAGEHLLRLKPRSPAPP
ncbi:MAG: hypothetical protein FJ272_03150, partial [Planctomycetes bacterium]|nr:hypothetical protein [Planctomycetota bacterium]